MKALFVGHDHINDFVVDFEGLQLGYGRKTGYGCYGPAPGYAFHSLFYSLDGKSCLVNSVVVVFSNSARRNGL